MDRKPINFKFCEYCEANATCLCFECLEYYCDSCFKSNHEKKLKSKHERDNIDPFIPFNLKCPIHSKVPNNLFCSDEKSKFIYFIFFYYL